MNNTKMVFKLFFIFNLEKEEAWLREMSNKGWHLQYVRFLVFYHFVLSEPKDIIYKIDFKSRIKDEWEYYSIFKDLGWDIVCKAREFKYFKQNSNYANKIPSIYNNEDEKIRWLGGRLSFVNSIVAFMIFDVTWLYAWTSNMNDGMPFALKLSIVCLVFILILDSVFIVSYIKLIIKNRKTPYYEKKSLRKILRENLLYMAPVFIILAAGIIFIRVNTVGYSEKEILNEVFKNETEENRKCTFSKYVNLENNDKVLLCESKHKMYVEMLQSTMFNRYIDRQGIKCDMPNDDFVDFMKVTSEGKYHTIVFGANKKHNIKTIEVEYFYKGASKKEYKIDPNEEYFIFSFEDDKYGKAIKNIRLLDENNKQILDRDGNHVGTHIKR